MFPTIGILGAGQLGRMTAQAALRMGLHVRFLTPKPSGAVDGLGHTTVADWTDPAVLRTFAKGCSVVTLESEWAPGHLLEPVLPEGVRLWPRPATVQMIRHKGRQKQALRAAGLPVPPFARCATLDDARAAAAAFGYPVMMKQYQRSYDGYGNASVRNEEGLQAAWNVLSAEDGALIEAWVPFVRELSVLVARRPDGERVVYPVAYSEQKDYRCHAVVVPASISPAVDEAARRIGVDAVETVEGVGLTAVELFETAEGEVLINELAPRPHNTGHYSIEGSYTSQFENHVRAILGWPLGDPSLREPVAVMINILGHRTGAPQMDGYLDALSTPGVTVHLYGKSEVRPKRKMGHITATGSDPAEARARAEQAADAIRL